MLLILVFPVEHQAITVVNVKLLVRMCLKRMWQRLNCCSDKKCKVVAKVVNYLFGSW